MRRRGYLSIAAALAAGTLALTACSSSGSNSSSSSPSTFGVNATGTVHFWARQATDGPAIALVKEFNKTHKHLKVVLHLTPPNDDTSQLATAIRAGSPPDVVGLNDIDVPTFSHEGALMDLTKYINALPYKKSLSPGHLALATIGSKYYGLPYLADLSVLWYNKKLFSEAGLNPNDPPTNYAQIMTDATKISALGHGIYGFSFAGDCQGCLGFTMLPSLWADGVHMIQRAARQPDRQRRQRRPAEDDAGGLPDRCGRRRWCRSTTRRRTG